MMTEITETDPKHLIGSAIGSLTVTRCLGKYKLRNKIDYIYSCNCICGRQNVQILSQQLLNFSVTSCGCQNNKEDFIGRKYTRFTVMGPAATRFSASGKTHGTVWLCRCNCGNYREIRARALKTGMSRSCGCLQKEHVSKKVTDDLTGQRFGMLTVMYRNGSHYHGGYSAVWHCKCDCGREKDIIADSLKNGDTRSCGCNKSSKFEDFTQKYLIEHGYVKNVTFFREKTFSGLTGVGGGALRFDFYLKTKDYGPVLIECQGEQHYKSVKWFGGDKYFKSLQQNDQIKKDFTRKHHIKLITINYRYNTYDKIAQYLNKQKLIIS